jgi:LacI family transcriptional regulator
MLAFGALRQLGAHGMHCPRNISIIGMNNMPFMDSITPALATIRTPTTELGKHAAEILPPRSMARRSKTDALC